MKGLVLRNMEIRVRGWVKGLGLAYGEKSTEMKPNNKTPSDHLIPKMIPQTALCYLDVAIRP